MRLPFFLLAAALLLLYVRLPYRIFNSDVAIFGLMGEDILKYGYWPTYAYGQSYLFSILPYVYAVIRWLAPALSHVMALKLAGYVLSMGGLWLLFEALLLVQRQAGWGRGLAATIFCLLIASSSSYLFDIQEHSSLEISLFLLGFISFFAARIDAALARENRSRWWDWLFFGLGLSHALYSRPLVFAYGAMMLIWLIAMQRRRTLGWDLRWPLYALLGGALLGYLPMILHDLLRAPTWPYSFHTHTPFAQCDKAHPGSMVFWTMFRIIFGLQMHHLLFSFVVVLWLIGTAWGCIYFLRRSRQALLTVLDVALPTGTFWIITVMAAFPNLSVNATHRRYCEHLFLAAVWLFARFAPQMLPRRWPALVLALMVFVTSFFSWKERLFYEIHVNDTMARQLPAVVAELKSYHAPILADFWDAYELRFLSNGELPIEAYPWQFVRTFNAIPREALCRRCLWLVREEKINSVKEQLLLHFHGNSWRGASVTELQAPLLSRQFEYWELGAPASLERIRAVEMHRHRTLYLWDLNPHESVRMMTWFNPRYFSTPNPPRP